MSVDIALLKTFLEVNRTRHFGHAAKNLFLTQSAVSARLRLLEDTLGVTLFTRDRNNIRLTPAGNRFLPHAETIVNAWNRACQVTALEDASRVPLSIGGVFSLWDILLQDWLLAIHDRHPEVALQAEAQDQMALVRRLQDGVLDVAALFEPPQAGELAVVEQTAISLVMVSSEAGLDAQAAVARADYIMVDWGTAFAVAHARHFPDMPPPAMRVAYGRIASEFMLRRGGSAYLAQRAVSEPLQAGLLHRVEGAPVIERRVYVARAEDSPRAATVAEMLALLPKE